MLVTLVLMLAMASAHSAETIHGGGRDRIQITINAGQKKELRLAPGTKIRRTSNLVFEVVVRDAQEACELEQTINSYHNSDSAPCSHEPEENTLKQTEQKSKHHGIRFAAETSEREARQTYKTDFDLHRQEEEANTAATAIDAAVAAPVTTYVGAGTATTATLTAAPEGSDSRPQTTSATPRFVHM
jgi:hypothetical protein